MPVAILIAGIQAAMVALARITMAKALAAVSMFVTAIVAQTILLSMLSGNGISLNPLTMASSLSTIISNLLAFSPLSGWAIWAAGIDILMIATFNGVLLAMVFKLVLGDRVR